MMINPAKQTTVRELRRCTSVVFPTGPYGDLSATDAARVERLIATSGQHQLRLIAGTQLMAMLWPAEVRHPPETGPAGHFEAVV